jgi:hypothetical protein
MATYLTKSEVTSLEAQVRVEFERLIGHRLLTSQPPVAKQWQFFRHCFNVLMGDPCEEFRYNDGQIRYYKSEVSQRLNWFYSALPDMPFKYYFRLEHVSKKHKFMEAEADYPSCKQYLLLISHAVARELDRQERQNILFRAVDDAVNAEFMTYRRLPVRDLRPLEEFFDPTGPAYKRICETVEQHHRNGEVISNDGNPSRKELRTLKILREDEERAEVGSIEYWYMRWWSLNLSRYTPKVYEGRNRQLYILVKRGSRWLVWDNPYRPPRPPLP